MCMHMLCVATTTGRALLPLLPPRSHLCCPAAQVVDALPEDAAPLVLTTENLNITLARQRVESVVHPA